MIELAIVVVMILLVVTVAVGRWTADYLRPQWRKKRWQDRDIVQYHPKWQSWWAWRPVRTISGRVVWWQTVYRNIGNDFVDYDNWRWYHYADEFDILRHS